MAGTYMLLRRALNMKLQGGFQVPGAGSKATSAGRFCVETLAITALGTNLDILNS
jgi:hypothetical protein